MGFDRTAVERPWTFTLLVDIRMYGKYGQLRDELLHSVGRELELQFNDARIVAIWGREDDPDA